MDDVDTTLKVVAAITSAWEDGCPVAGMTSADREQIAHVSLRRWDGFARRHKKGSKEEQVEDLAKGLRDAYEPDRHLVGPLMEDYRYLASMISGVLLADESAMSSS